ncbi:hypothetical protein ACDF64_12760 [Agromyces sp. MMS24-JH15]|uniref:hypothetical protein n=1 Tax=Agromyces sp. MMS24-JH15 TaxID=3243765 RepID=UPI00374990D7
MRAFFAKRVLLWPLLLTGVLVVSCGVIGAPAAMRALPTLSLFGTESEERDTQVIQAVVREEQVVLLSLGIQGISEKNDTSTFLGTRVPGSERATFVQYAFSAKLGIDGGAVTIEQTGEDEYLISIPEFEFIGHDDERFELVGEQNGVLSWMTPEIDTVEMINAILSDDVKHEYLDANEKILQDQAQAFYSGIITSIDPTLTVRFAFRD